MTDTLAQNPFLQPFGTPHGTVPFDRIRTEHFEPAVREGIRHQLAVIDAITSNPDEPTFANTIEAYERSGRLLSIVSNVFGNLHSAETNDELDRLAEVLMPLLSEHSNNISLNPQLFERVKYVHEHTDRTRLTPEQQTLLEETYRGFVRNGADLQGEARDRYRALCQELSLLTLNWPDCPTAPWKPPPRPPARKASRAGYSPSRRPATCLS